MFQVCHTEQSPPASIPWMNWQKLFGSTGSPRRYGRHAEFARQGSPTMASNSGKKQIASPSVLKILLIITFPPLVVCFTFVVCIGNVQHICYRTAIAESDCCTQENSCNWLHFLWRWLETLSGKFITWHLRVNVRLKNEAYPTATSEFMELKLDGTRQNALNFFSVSFKVA